MRIIAVTNHKGGVGKTTTSLNLGAGLVRKFKKKVLLIDLDPQAHLTYSLGFQSYALKNTAYEILMKKATAADTIVKQNGLDLIPSSIKLAAAEIELTNEPAREFILSEAMAKVKGYDFVFIDCPPRLGVLTLNALVYAREVFIPVQTEALSLNGLKEISDTIEVVKRRLNKKLKITAVIGTRYDKRKNLNREVVESLREHFKAKVFNTLIRENIALAEAPGSGKDIFSYQPRSKGAEDYLSLAKETLGGRT